MNNTLSICWNPKNLLSLQCQGKSPAENDARNQFILRNHHLDVFSDHNPPHFHVKYQGYEATIDIATGTVKGQLPRRALNMVYEWLDQHKDELMANWQKMENSEPFDKIKPLE